MLPFNLSPYSIRGLRTVSAAAYGSKSHDQFTATLFRSDRPVAQVSSLLSGDTPIRMPWENPPEAYVLEVEFKTRDEMERYKHFVAEARLDPELARFMARHAHRGQAPELALIYVLAYEYYMRARLRENCARHTLYRLPNEDENAWSIVKVPYRQGLAKAIRRLYPDAIIANELVSTAPA